jgi:hypothetical protein
MMKKVLFILSLALLSVSCLKGGKFESTYTAVGDFEYTSENYSSLFLAPDSTYFPDYFYIGNAMACNAKKSGNTFLGGCFLAIGRDTVISSVHSVNNSSSRYKVVSGGGGAFKSRTYMIFYDNPDTASMPKYAIKSVLSSSGTCKMNVCYVNNTNEVVNDVIYGNGSVPAFKSGDWIKLKVTGYSGGTVTGSAEMYLADFTKTPAVVIEDWTKLDISALGIADAVDFSISSNVEGIPPYVCIDNFYANIHLIQ